MRIGFPGRPGSIPWAPRFLISLAALSLGACQVIGGSGAGPSPTDTGEFGTGEVYQGFLEMDGGRVSAALEMVREGRRGVRGALQATSGLLADGEGEVRGGTLSLNLSYQGDCPGRMFLEGEWDQDAKTYEGTVEASDCTGNGRGTFSFSGS